MNIIVAMAITGMDSQYVCMYHVPAGEVPRVLGADPKRRAMISRIREFGEFLIFNSKLDLGVDMDWTQRLITIHNLVSSFP
jgi:hypothetical protein